MIHLTDAKVGKQLSVNPDTLCVYFEDQLGAGGTVLIFPGGLTFVVKESEKEIDALMTNKAIIAS